MDDFFPLRMANQFRVLNKAKLETFLNRTSMGVIFFLHFTFLNPIRGCRAHIAVWYEKYHIAAENSKRHPSQTAPQFIKRKRIRNLPYPPVAILWQFECAILCRRISRRGCDGKIWFTIMIVISFSLRRETMCFM